MKAKRRLLSAGIAAAMLLCGAPAYPRIIDGVVALVNDEPITFSEVREEVAGGLGVPLGDADAYLREERDTAAVLRWINALVEAALVRKELAKKGSAVADAEVDKAIGSVRKANNVDEAQFIEILAREGLTPAAYRNRIRWQLERGAIVRALKHREVTVTEDEVRAYYRENAERFARGGQVRLETMLFPIPEGESAEEAVVRARFAAQQALASLPPGRPLADGIGVARAAFPAVELFAGDFLPEEDLLPEMRREIARLRSGERSGPFPGEHGVYIVRVVERRGGTPREFREVMDILAEEMTDRRSEKAYADIIEELKRSASIDVRL
ncbi:MAG: peptidylprolyl isomerase [Thermodesulfobacteriota bacterium]